MAQPYVGEIRMFAGNFAPAGWEFCSGQLLSISENETLFQLIGTTYGGDGQETFALPNLQSRLPLHQGTGPGLSGRLVGEASGVESITLTVQQIPSHSHTLIASADSATAENPAGNLTGQPTASIYGMSSPFSAMDPQAVSPVGGSQPHDNLQPYLCVSFIISLFGIFPSQT